MSGTSLAVALPFRLTKIVVTPARVKLRRKSSFGVSCSLRSSRSVTCLSVSSTVAPGQAACTTIVLMMKAGSSLRPSPNERNDPADHRNDHQEYGQRAMLERPFRKIEGGHGSDPKQADLLTGMQGLYAGGDHDLAGIESFGDGDAGWVKAQHLDIANATP